MALAPRAWNQVLDTLYDENESHQSTFIKPLAARTADLKLIRKRKNIEFENLVLVRSRYWSFVRAVLKHNCYLREFRARRARSQPLPSPTPKEMYAAVEEMRYDDKSKSFRRAPTASELGQQRDAVGRSRSPGPKPGPIPSLRPSPNPNLTRTLR